MKRKTEMRNADRGSRNALQAFLSRRALEEFETLRWLGAATETIPRSAFRVQLVDLAFKYPNQLLNRGRQTKLLACSTQTGSAQVLSLFRVQEQTSDG